MEIKINSDDDLLSEKTLNIHCGPKKEKKNSPQNEFVITFGVKKYS